MLRLVPKLSCDFGIGPEEDESGVFFRLRAGLLLPFTPLHSTSDTILAQGVFHSNGNSVEILLLSWVRDKLGGNSVFGKLLMGSRRAPTTRSGVYPFEYRELKATFQKNRKGIGEQKAKLVRIGLF